MPQQAPRSDPASAQAPSYSPSPVPSSAPTMGESSGPTVIFVTIPPPEIFVPGVPFEDAPYEDIAYDNTPYENTSYDNTPLIVSDRMQEVELDNYYRLPETSGFCFADSEVIPFNNEKTDLYFGSDGAAHFICVPKDADVTDLGPVASLSEVVEIPQGQWSPAHRDTVEAGHVYATKTWAGGCYLLRVKDVWSNSIRFDWKWFADMSKKKDDEEMFGR